MSDSQAEALRNREHKNLNIRVVQEEGQTFVIDEADGKVIRNVISDSIRTRIGSGSTEVRLKLLFGSSDGEYALLGIYSEQEQNEQDGS